MRSSKMSLNKMTIYAMFASYPELYFGENPIKLNLLFQRYNHFSAEYYYLLYLKINTSEFRLILLDHITNTSNAMFG